MDDWSLPDNTDSSINSGIVDNVFFWKFQPFDSLGLNPSENSSIQKKNQQPNSSIETSSQMPSDEFQDEVDKLFQQSLALQEQQEREQLQKQQQQKQPHSFQPHTSYSQPIHHTQTPFNHMHTQQNSK